MYVGVMLNNESVKMYADKDTTIFKEKKMRELEDHSFGDEVEASYIKKGGF